MFFYEPCNVTNMSSVPCIADANAISGQRQSFLNPAPVNLDCHQKHWNQCPSEDNHSGTKHKNVEIYIQCTPPLALCPVRAYIGHSTGLEVNCPLVAAHCDPT